MALIMDLVSLESVLSKKLRDRRMSASFLGEKGSDEISILGSEEDGVCGGPDQLGRVGPLPVGDFVGGKDMNGPN